ncbi:MAG: diguanylate cyclase [Desulfamplus sp.]|nr:diguanylate cyclase [Desulfamplus sp.]
MATIEISEYAKTNNLFSYHMTSLNPVNPSNNPDEFEKRALNLFEQGDKEVWIKEKNDGKIYFRYMAPVFREESCLVCHEEQQQRDKTDKEKRFIRGGISVKFDISRIEKSLKIHAQLILFLGILSTSLFLGIIYLFTVKLMKELSKSHQKIQQMAITDELTKLYNRRYFYSKLTEEFEKAKRYKRDISCIMIDIDFFKKVNDNYGHHVGDDVLRNIADTIKSTCRSVDTIARYGGEEIVVLLPETNKEKAFLVAEKIRKVVEKIEIPYDKGDNIQITISSGVSGLLSDDLEKVTDSNQLVKDADIALYQAKTNGRNRVEIYTEQSLSLSV